MSRLILLNICLFCVLSIGLADLNNNPISDDSNKTTVVNDKKMIILDAKPVLKSPNARDLKQSESHIGILYPHHPHFHHHGLHHHGYHHYPYHKYHHLHHHPFYHHHLHYPYLHHHHYHSHFHKYPYYHGHYPYHHHHYPYYGYLHFFNIYGLNFSPFSLLNYPLYHLNHLKRPIHSPHHFLPYLHHPNHCRCECSKSPHGYGMKPPPTHSYVNHLSKSKPYAHHDLPIHSLNGHPINNHPLNNPTSLNGHSHHHSNGHPHHLNGHPHHLNEHAIINGHAINGHSTNGHSIPLHFQRPHFKINTGYEPTTVYESYKSTKFNNEKIDKKIDRTNDKINDKDANNKDTNYEKLPPDELMNQLVDFDMSYLLPKHDHPALHSLMEDRYRRLLYGQFHELNQMSPTYLYESLPDQLSNNHGLANKFNNKDNKFKNKDDSKFDKKFNSEFDTKFDAKFDSKFDTKFDAKFDSKYDTNIDSKYDTKFDSKYFDNSIPSKSISNKQKKSNQKMPKKDSEHLQLKNGGHMHLIKMGIIK